MSCLPQKSNWRKNSMRTVAIAISSAIVLPACNTIPTSQSAPQSTYDPCTGDLARNIGIVAGGILGGIIAKQLSDSKSAVPVGLVIGGLVGAAIGKDVAKRQCDVFKVAQKNNIQFVSAQLKLPAVIGTALPKAGEDVVGLSATLIDKDGQAGHFLPGSDRLTPTASAYFAEIARSYVPATRMNGLNAQERVAIEKSKLLIVGHTDDQEDSAKAAELSERRAKTVATVFRNAGVPDAAIYYQGAGETLPLADNKTEAFKNRRVEIIDLANDEVMTAYLKSRVSTSSYFRPVQPAISATAEQLAEGAKAPEAETLAKPKPAVRRPLQEKPTLGVPPTVTPATVAQAPTTGLGIDFGGNVFNVTQNQVNIGEPVQNSGFSVFSVARADDPPSKSCVYDRPRISRSVKSLRDASDYKVSDMRPGAYGSSWVGMVNGHLLALNNVAVVRAGGLPASDPNVLIYKNFDPKGGASRKADFSATPMVNSYSGTKGLLYRVFFEKNAPLRCIDVVLPATAPFKAEQGFVYQDKKDQTFAVEFKPELPARKL